MGGKPRIPVPGSKPLRPLSICPETDKPHVFSKDWEKGPDGIICCEACGESDDRVHYVNWSSQHDQHLACFDMKDPDGWIWVYGTESDQETIHTHNKANVNCPYCLAWLEDNPEAP